MTEPSAPPDPSTPDQPAGDPAAPPLDRAAVRKRLIAQRRSWVDRDARVKRLSKELGTWLMHRTETVIGAYWPVRGEPDLLPLLGTWVTAAPGRVVGLPVIDPATSRLFFRPWHPGAAMRDDAFGIPTPDTSETVAPDLLLVPCVGFGPGGVRLGYGGGYYDRTLGAMAGPRPLAVGVAFKSAFVADLAGAPHDIPMDVILTDGGIAWGR